MIDLHTHTTASDGALAPQALIEAACAAGITMLSITDHDVIDAYADLDIPDTLTLIRGIEFSTWHARAGVHIVGLNIAFDNDQLSHVIERQSQARQIRAERIAQRLAKRGIADALTGAARHAGNGAIGRPHFAAYLVEIHAAASIEQAFKKYLGRDGGIIDVWAPMPEIIAAIHAAGGSAVLAHPAKYGLTRSGLERLVRAFATAGGAAIEVISGMQRPELTRDLANLAARFQLAASIGSDFHQPGQPWAQLGRLPELPIDCRPVWESWN